MNVLDLIKKYDGKAVVDSVSFEIPKGKGAVSYWPQRSRKVYGNGNDFQAGCQRLRPSPV